MQSHYFCKNLKRNSFPFCYSQVIRTLKWLVLPVDISAYLIVFKVPQVKDPSSKDVPLSCNPGKWHRVFFVFRFPLNE